MSSTLARLLSDLDIAVLERNKNNSFTLLSDVPPWLSTLWPNLNEQQEHLHPEKTFLFLEDFLDRHAGFWDIPTDERLTSGIWTEVLPDGKNQLLQAVALFIESHPLLLIRIPPHQETWSIYQQAREQRLENEQLIEEINKREVLLHCIVHDLSNPLAGIKGSFDVLLSEELIDPDGSELLHLGLRQAKKMQQLIQSILSTFANEVKPLVPTLIGEDIAPNVAVCVKEVVSSLNATANLKGVTINIDHSDSSTPFKVVGEPERLERVLFNLLVNAIRHTPEGCHITVRLRDDDDGIYVAIEDEGPGVPDQFVDNLFNRFSQGSQNTGLAGLGLYFCRITIENWGGAIGYSPRESGGACFWFRLPKPAKQFDALVHDDFVS